MFRAKVSDRYYYEFFHVSLTFAITVEVVIIPIMRKVRREINGLFIMMDVLCKSAEPLITRLTYLVIEYKSGKLPIFVNMLSHSL